MKQPFSSNPPVALTIAGVDSGGGAGVPADLKTFAALGVHGTCAVTALTAQNTMGVTRVMPVPPEMVEEQIRTTVADLGCDGLKTGMLANQEIVEAVARCVRELHLAPLVVDPVMVATSGARLLEPGAEAAYREQLIPLARVITPNLAEAEALLGHSFPAPDGMPEAAAELAELGCEAVIITGGHLTGQALDVVYERKTGRAHFLAGALVPTEATHGSGCVFAAALAAHLACGEKLGEAARLAKEFVTSAIKYALDLGQGPGPVNPLHRLSDQGGRV